MRWTRGERSAQAAPAAWDSTVAAVGGTTLIALCWYVLCSIPAALYVGSITHLSALGELLFIVFMTILGIGVAVFAYLFFEQALRPVAREIAARLPADFAPARRGLSLRTRLLVLLPAINIFTGSVVAAASTNSLGLEGRLAVTLAASLVVSMTLSLALTLMFRQSLLLRLKGLRQAIGRLDSGDYRARVPHLAGDELDAVGDSFNRMAAGLQERELLERALGSYIDADIALRLLSEGEIIQGREVEVTVLFLDIRDFTAFADRSTAADVVRFLSEFFELVIPILRTHQGHPNKLLGDGLLAVFGAPTPLHAHADHALAAAKDILTAVADHYNGELHLGIGVHTGLVVAGTIGGGGKLDYTLIGDTVNVAARVQELTKETGEELLITEATRGMLSGAAQPLRARGAQQLRGKADQTPIYAVEVKAKAARARPARPLSGPRRAG
jgi:class 3 adenylate cyclase